LKTILEMAENYGVTITIEPHGVYTTNAEGLLRIMDLSDSKYLAINFDTGNVTIAGNDALETMKAVIDYVVHVHLKDVKRPETDTGETGVVAGMAIGDGDVDIKGCIDLLKEHNYDGCLAIECAGVDAIKKSVKYLQPLIA